MSQTDKISNQILGQYAKQMKTKGLYAAGGGGGEKNGKINLIEITFDVDHILNIETAREYMVDSTLNLMDLINKMKNSEIILKPSLYHLTSFVFQ